MEVNKDEASRCLDIARNHLAKGNIASAIKFAQKSINLYLTTEAQVFLKRAESSKATSNGSNKHRSPSPTPPSSPSSSSREHKQGRQTREYTIEQAEAVKRIRAC